MSERFNQAVTLFFALLVVFISYFVYNYHELIMKKMVDLFIVEIWIH
jgi:hypothetical protein